MSEQGAGGQGTGGQGTGGHAPGLWPVPGDGVLARKGGLVLLSSLEDSQFVDVLLDLLEQVAAAGGDGRHFADAVADALESGTPEQAAEGPSLLAFGPTKTGLAVTVSGGAWADVTTAHGTTRIEAGHPGMLMRCVLRTPATGIEGGLSHAENGTARTDRFSRLDAGTVRASGLAFFVTGPAEAQGGAAGRPASLAKVRSGRPAGGQAPSAPAPVQAGAGVSAPDDEAAEEPAPEPVAEQAAAEQAAAGQAAEPAWEPQAGSEPGPAGLMPEAEQAPVRYEPTAAWIPPAADAQARATEQWTPDWDGSQEPAAGGAAAEAAGAEQPAPEPELTIPPQYSEFGEPFEAVLLQGQGAVADVPGRAPLPLARDIPPGASSYVSQGPVIQGVFCANGHFDDPEALACAICGISMNKQTLVPRPGERPPLGVLLLDDGSVFQLDNDYVIGREPSLDASVAGGEARALRVADESGIVSRVHARVHLEGWRVLVTDLGSANGTRVQLAGQPGEQQLVPQVPMVLTTGSQVDMGGRAFRYESHRGR